MADPSAVDLALATLIEADATLQGLIPSLLTDGVAWDVLPPNVTRGIVLSLEDHEDVDGLNDRTLYEIHHYIAKAVDRNTDGTVAKNAANRLHTLITTSTLSISGYSHMSTKRTGRIRDTVPDSDTDQHWQHRGGRYDVHVSPT